MRDVHGIQQRKVPLVCKETKLKQVKSQGKVPLWESFKTTCRNPTFVRLVAVVVLLIVGFQLVMGFSNFISIFFLYLGNKEPASTLMAANGTLWAAIGIVGVFPMTWLSSRFGKRFTVLASLAIMIAGNLLKIVCYNRAYPWLTLIPTTCLSLGMVFCFSLVNSMISDICDEDEYSTGIRREGIYFAAYNWSWTVTVSIASIVNGYLLRLTGFDETIVHQSEATLF